MSLGPSRSLAPRAPSVGALRLSSLIFALALAPGVPDALAAQEPPDSVRAAGDSLQQVPDSLQQVLDSLAAVVDSVAQAVDTFPRFPSGAAPSYGAAVWRWDRAQLMSNRALTLAELVSQIPGVLALRGGDYGTPATVTSFGAAAGRVRVMWDGFEPVPLDGGVPDLSRIGLAGLDEVRVERHPGELLIELRSLEPTEPDPMTRVDVGTGDLSTNVLRGILTHPNTLGGALTFVLDRVETRGPGLEVGGSLSGVGLRYGLYRGNRGGLVAELRRFTTKTDVEDFPSSITRSDWNVKGRWRFTDDLTAEAFWGASSLSGNEDDPVYGFIDARRSQLGLRAGYERGGLWGRGAARFFSGEGIQDRSYELEGGARYPRALSVDASLRLEKWTEESLSSWRARMETTPRFGLSLFASYEKGKRGGPFVPEFEDHLRSLEPAPMDPDNPEAPDAPPDTVAVDTIPRPLVRITDRTGIRAGATLSWRSLRLSGAWLSMEADSLRPLGLLLDRDGLALEGGKRTGYEVSFSLPLPKAGYRLEGAVQSWKEELSYLPKSTWDAAITYHGIFKESRNLELWWTVGVTGRDAMALRIRAEGAEDPPPPPPEDDPDAEIPAGPLLERVPLSREYFGQIQVRIVTLNVFVRWENLAAKDDNFDFPGRRQPRFRTLYGVRWTMNN